MMERRMRAPVSSFIFSQHGLQQHNNHVHLATQSISHEQQHESNGGYHQPQQRSHHLGGGGPKEREEGVGTAPYPRNTSKDILPCSLIDLPVVLPMSTSETSSPGFLACVESFRVDRAKIFNRWLKSHSSNLDGMNSFRANTAEIFNNLLNTDNSNPENLSQNQDGKHSGSFPSPAGSRPRKNPRRNIDLAKEKGDHNSLNLLQNMRFNASSPITRSQSSELRRRYAQAQMEGLPFPAFTEALQKQVSNRGTMGTNDNVAMTSPRSSPQEMGHMESPQTNPVTKPIGSQYPLAQSSSVRGMDGHQMRGRQPEFGKQNGGSVSDVVGLLECNLKLKKLEIKQQIHHQVPQHQEQGLRSMQDSMSPPLRTRQEHLQNRSGEHKPHSQDEDGNVSIPPVQQTHVQRIHSPCESTGMATSDSQANSGVSVHRRALKRSSAAVDVPSPQLQAISGFDSPSAHSNGDAYEKRHLTRAESVTSSLKPGYEGHEIDGARKKRCVERQRKCLSFISSLLSNEGESVDALIDIHRMGEAKGRGNGPPMPADLQAVVKRCDSLEKEVRSLKLNLSFLNRKDSEQTKRIEELEQISENLKVELDAAK